MKLVSVYERLDCYELLYRLLAERDEAVNISHKKMPGWCEHAKFVNSKPYKAWYFICDPDPVGACYLSHQNEIGIFILKEHHKKGYGRKAIAALIGKHGPGRYLANVSPRNEVSQKLFEALGFKLCQHTYEFSHKSGAQYHE